MKSIIFFAPLIVVNLWHGVVIGMGRVRGGAFASISESAVRSRRVFWAHRVVHVLGAGCFLVFAAVSLPSLRYIAVVLMAAAVLDALQALYLSEETDHAPLNMRDVHQRFAWVMAVSYLSFTVLFALHAQMPTLLLLSYGGALVVAAGGNKVAQFRYFWAAQMLFFVLTSLVMAVSYMQHR